MINNRDEIFAAIVRERDFQDRKRGTPEERQLNIATYLQIAQRELNEAMCAIVDGEADNALCEALQVAATLVACLERHGVRERWLNLLFEEQDDDNNIGCRICKEHGACLDWVECMADDARVPAEWLAEQVVKDCINHEWSIEDVETAYTEVQS